MIIPLDPGDRVVAAFSHQDVVVVVTEFGRVYRLVVSLDPAEESI